jgi:hypothetical protein
LAECAAHIGTEFLKLWPYNTAGIHSLLLSGSEVQIQYCMVSGIGIKGVS